MAFENTPFQIKQNKYAHKGMVGKKQISYFTVRTLETLGKKYNRVKQTLPKHIVVVATKALKYRCRFD